MEKHWQHSPFLKTKAAETKHLLPCIAIISDEVSTGTDHDLRRTAALQAITSFCKLLDLAGTFLTPEQADYAEMLVIEFLGHYAWLNEWAQANDRPEYHIVPKFHMLHHLALNARHLNPKVHWCFKAEDYVGKISTLAHSASMGVRSTLISQKNAIKYRYLLHLRLTRGDHQ